MMFTDLKDSSWCNLKGIKNVFVSPRWLLYDLLSHEVHRKGNSQQGTLGNVVPTSQLFTETTPEFL